MYVDLNVKKYSDKLNQILISNKKDDSSINMDHKENLICLCIRDINEIEQLDNQKLFYLFNIEKESILIWLILSKFFYKKE